MGCVSACSAGFVRSPSTSVCVPCDETCNTCGTTATQCTSCSAPRFLENSQCVISCTGGYRDVNTRTCQACDGTCASCSGPTATQCVTCPAARALYDNRCVLECPAGTTESAGVCLERDCDPDASGYTSTVTSQSRSAPTFTDAGEPQLAQVLCAFGDANEACLITGAQLQETITTSFSVSATVVCTLGCDDPVTRTFTKRFQATSVVTWDDYRLIAAINPSASNFEAVAQTFLTSSEQLQAFYRSADNVFEQDLDQNRRFVCDGSRLEFLKRQLCNVVMLSWLMSMVRMVHCALLSLSVSSLWRIVVLLVDVCVMAAWLALLILVRRWTLVMVLPPLCATPTNVRRTLWLSSFNWCWTLLMSLSVMMTWVRCSLS